MKATHCSESDIYKALCLVNEKYLNNIRFYELRSSGKATLFRLKTLNPKLPGTARAYSGKRTGSGCWHVHGDLFDALLKINPEAVISTATSKITQSGGNWEDYNVGSNAEPLYASEACDCEFSSGLIGRSTGTEEDFIHAIKRMDANKIEDLLNIWRRRYGKLILTHCNDKLLPLYAEDEEFFSIVTKRLSKRRA